MLALAIYEPLQAQSVGTGTAQPNVKYARLKLEVPGFDFMTPPKVLWLDGQSNQIVRFGLGINEKDGEIVTLRMDSVSASEKQMLLCDSIVRLMGNLKSNGAKTKIESFLARGTITFSDPSLGANTPNKAPGEVENSAAANGQVSDELTFKVDTSEEVPDADTVEARRAEIIRPNNVLSPKSPASKSFGESIYPIVVSGTPYDRFVNPDLYIGKYKEFNHYLAYIDKNGKNIFIDSSKVLTRTGNPLLEKMTGVNWYGEDGKIAPYKFRYRSLEEEAKMQKNYGPNFLEDYRIKSAFNVMNFGNCTPSRFNCWALKNSSGGIATSFLNFLPPSPCKKGPGSYIRYVGDNRYWVSRTNDGQWLATFLVDGNGKVLMESHSVGGKNKFGYPFSVNPLSLGIKGNFRRYTNGKLGLAPCTVIDLNGKKIYQNSNYELIGIIDDYVLLAYTQLKIKRLYVGFPETLFLYTYINYVTGKVIYTQYDFEKEL